MTDFGAKTVFFGHFRSDLDHSCHGPPAWTTPSRYFHGPRHALVLKLRRGKGDMTPRSDPLLRKSGRISGNICIIRSFFTALFSNIFERCCWKTDIQCFFEFFVTSHFCLKISNYIKIPKRYMAGFAVWLHWTFSLSPPPLLSLLMAVLVSLFSFFLFFPPPVTFIKLGPWGSTNDKQG